MSKKNDSAKEPLSLAMLERDFFARPDVASQDFDLNYCIPINIGILAQEDQPSFDREAIRDAVIGFGQRMQKLFGRFSGRSNKKHSNDSRIQLNLVVLSGGRNSLTDFAKGVLTDLFQAEVTEVDSLDEMKAKSWLVLALWDGIAAGECFDTVKGILCCRPGEGLDRSEPYTLALPENRPVFQVVLPVGEGDEKGIRNYALRDIYPRINEGINSNGLSEVEFYWFDRAHYASDKKNARRRKRFEQNSDKIKLFNAAAIHYATQKNKQTTNIWNPLQQHMDENVSLSIPAEVALLRNICYDAISMFHQTNYGLQLMVVLILACTGLFCFSLYSELADTFAPLVYAFITLFVLAYVYYFFRIKKSKSHRYYLEFRSLAEGMRTQCHWYTAGISQSTGKNYRIKFSKDMSWAKYALNVWNEIDTAGYNLTDSSNLRLVCNEYLGGQQDYFQRKINPKKKGNIRISARRLSALNLVIKVVWCAFAALLGIAVWFRHSNINVYVFLMEIINILALVLSYYKEKKQYKLLVSRYTYCNLLVNKAIADYEYYESQRTEKGKKQTDENIRQVFTHYGIEALAENAEWLLIENDREPDVPNG